ncbi:CHC2 zinc finger domain-containing protein, partial [Akkermansiaceae bacterium]|nr:CHC2 zinc finger domain-containing protein [Akkermansiaceae bacterium]
MKKPPFQVAPSQSRSLPRQAEVTTQDNADKLDQIKEMLPHYLERYWPEKIHRKTETCFQLHCPFHEDKTPSFIADNNKSTWLFHCFACKKSGSIIDLHAEDAGLPRRSFEAIQSTAQSVGIELGLLPALSPAERKKWARAKQESDRLDLARSKEKEDLQRLTLHQRKTLSEKLAPYMSEDWRADLYHSSPLWTETPEESTLAFLSILFPPEAMIWMGKPYDTGQERHRENFKCTQDWLKETSLPPRIAAGTFQSNSFSRSKGNLKTSPFVIIESDDLIGHKPTNAGERNTNKALSYALAGYCQQELGLHLRAVIDTGNKSLHLWFDQPPPKALAAVRMLAPGLCIDTGLLDSCATAP